MSGKKYIFRLFEKSEQQAKKKFKVAGEIDWKRMGEFNLIHDLVQF